MTDEIEHGDSCEHCYKIAANRVRRKAARQGFGVTISRVRDPRASEYKTVDLYRAENDSGHWRSRESLFGGQMRRLDEIERFLDGEAV